MLKKRQDAEEEKKGLEKMISFRQNKTVTKVTRAEFPLKMTQGGGSGFGFLEDAADKK